MSRKYALCSTRQRFLALLLTFVMVFVTMTSALGVENYAAPADESQAAPIAIVPLNPPEPYRNLNLTPGGAVTEMRFTWHSQSPTGSLRLYDVGEQAPLQTVTSTTQVLESRSTHSTWFPGETPDYTVHQITLTGLAADTYYEYVVVGEGFTSERKVFRTGTAGDNFRFIVAGDPQIGVGLQQPMLDLSGWTNTLDVAMEMVPDMAFVLSVGDQIHTNTANLPRSQYMYDILFAPPQLQSVPLVPVVGNHEAGLENSNGHLWHRHYNTGFNAANVRQHNTAQPIQFDYYMRWGNTLFIVLDSNTRTWGAGRLQWVEDVVDANQDAEWRVAVFHHPPYSAYRPGADSAKQQIISNWIPELERLDFDAVLAGHCHVYSRTHQMISNVPQRDQQWLDADGNIQSDLTGLRYNAVLDPTGIVYVSFNSASGSGFYNVQAMASRDYLAAYNQNFRRNFSVVEVTEHSFSIITYQINDDDSTTLVDVYTIVRSDQNGNVPSAVTNLRQMEEQELIRISQLAPIDEIRPGTPPSVAGFGLPATVGMQTIIRDNVGGNTVTIRNPAGPYGRGVRGFQANVVWDLENIDYDPVIMTLQVFTVTGTVILPDGILNPMGIPLVVEIQVSVGFDYTGDRPFDGYISYFGARHRFYGRTDSNFLYDAFDPEIFALWEGGGGHPDGAPTPIGFGTPRSGTGLVLATNIPDGPGPHQRGEGGFHSFTYMSRTFYLPDNFCSASMGNVRGIHQLDDVVVLFINGIEVYRANTDRNDSDNIRIGAPVDWGTFVGHNTDAQLRPFTINYDFEHQDMGVANQANDLVTMHHAASRTNLEYALRPGQNVMTAVIGQNSPSSSDLWWNLEMHVEFNGCRCHGIPISYFGARHRFYGRTDSAFFYDAFDPEAFYYWPGGGLHPDGAVTPIGFGTPSSGTGLILATNIPVGPGSHERGSPGHHTFTYMSRTFELPADFCSASIGNVHGVHQLDDVIVLFINGIEVYRANTDRNDSNNIRVGVPVDWGTFVGHNTDARNRSFTINYDFYHRNMGYPTQAGTTMMHDAASRTNLEYALRPGQNVMTAVVGQNAAGSSDLWWNLEMYVQFEGCRCEDDTSVFGLFAFNNGNDNNASLAQAGIIRIWTQLDGVNALVPYADLNVNAELPDGTCAMEFIRVNQPWANPGYVNLIDANKHEPWQTIYLTVALNGQEVELTLINNRFLGLRAYNNGTDAEVPSMAGNIRIWPMLGGSYSPIPMDAVITAIDQDGNDAMEFVIVNRMWTDTGWQDYNVNFDVNKDAPWETITFSVTVYGQTVVVELINDWFTPLPAQILGLQAFNNGNDNNASLAQLGVIRIWTQLDGVSALVPYADLTIEATLLDGTCAMEFVRVNRIWNNPDYVSLFDVNKNAPWQYIDFSVGLRGQVVSLLLVNNRYIPAPVEFEE